MMLTMGRKDSWMQQKGRPVAGRPLQVSAGMRGTAAQYIQMNQIIR